MTLLAELTDRELVDRAKAGDRDALDDLFRRHEARITALCRSRLRSPDDAADAVQETLARVLTRLHQLRDPDAFGPWLRTIAVRVCADHGRARSTHRWSTLTADTVDDAPMPHDVVEADDDRRQLQRMLHTLGERDRRALWLRHGLEAPISRVAAELGVTEGSARVLLTRARHRLRAMSSGLAGVIFPHDWRRWVRTHVEWLVQRPDLIAPVVPAAIVAALIVAVPDTPPETPAPIEIVSTGEVAPERDEAPTAPGPVEAAPEPPSVARAGASTTPPAAGEPADDAHERPRPVRNVVEDVRVQEDYPEDEPYLIEVSTITGNESAGENEFRIYGEVVEAPEDVGEVTEDLLSR